MTDFKTEHTEKKVLGESRTRILLDILILFPLFALVVVWLVFINQHTLIFHPNHSQEDSFLAFFSKIDSKKKIYEVRSADNHRINIYEICGENSGWDIVFFHGSIMHPKVHCKNMNKLAKITKCNVLTFCYRGFDASGKTPTESNLMIDTFAVKLFMDMRNTTKCLFGQSLGCSLALYFATLCTTPVPIILENPFYNGRTFIKSKGFSWIRNLLFIAHYSNDKRIKSLENCSMLFILAEKEDVIDKNDPLHLKRLANGICETSVIKGSKHFDMGKHDDYYTAVYNFVTKVATC